MHVTIRAGYSDCFPKGLTVTSSADMLRSHVLEGGRLVKHPSAGTPKKKSSPTRPQTEYGIDWHQAEPKLDQPRPDVGAFSGTEENNADGSLGALGAWPEDSHMHLHRAYRIRIFSLAFLFPLS